MNISFDRLSVKGVALYMPANFFVSSDLFACLKNENVTRSKAGYHLNMNELK